MVMMTQNFLMEALDYNPGTGVFTWLTRPCWHFNKTNKRTQEHSANNWNAAFAGSVAGGRHIEGYRSISISRKKFLCHRLAFLYMEGSMPSDEVDHINHDRSDNRWSNLRKVTRQENCKNRGLVTPGVVGVCGVYWCKHTSKYRSKIKVDGKSIHLGRFTDFFEACAARKSAESLFGFHENHGIVL
jgi:hypothetical protein